MFFFFFFFFFSQSCVTFSQFKVNSCPFKNKTEEVFFEIIKCRVARN